MFSLEIHSSQADVAKLLGTPSAQHTKDDNTLLAQSCGWWLIVEDKIEEDLWIPENEWNVAQRLLSEFGGIVFSASTWPNSSWSDLAQEHEGLFIVAHGPFASRRDAESFGEMIGFNLVDNPCDDDYLIIFKG